MAYKCPSCKNTITDFKFGTPCPFCKTPTPTAKSTILVIAGLVVALGAIVGIAASPSKESDSKQSVSAASSGEPKKSSALYKLANGDGAKEPAKERKSVASVDGIVLCHDLILERATIPSSVRFSWGHSTTEYTDGTFVLAGTFTHKNAYGVDMKKEYKCKVTLMKDGASVKSAKILSVSETY